jgi:hypothetical protein
MEAELAEPGLVQQVGRRQAMDYALLQAFQHQVALAGRQAGIEEGLKGIARQVQRGEQDPDRFVPGIVGTVAEVQAGFVEAADSPAQPIAQGDQFVGRAVDHGVSSLSKQSS